MDKKATPDETVDVTLPRVRIYDGETGEPLFAFNFVGNVSPGETITIPDFEITLE